MQPLGSQPPVDPQRLAKVTSMLLTHEAGKSRIAFLSHPLMRLLSLVLVGGYAAGQMAGNQMMQGNHSIEVHLTDQNGQALNLTVRVQVLTNEGLRMAEAYSNREQG